jgi:hypothetical protein
MIAKSRSKNNGGIVSAVIGLSWLWILLIFAVIVLLSKPDPTKITCASVEWDLQNAGDCAANPEAWARWDAFEAANPSQLGGITLGRRGCAIFLKAVQDYGFEKAIIPWLADIRSRANNDIDIAANFKKESGKDFCDYVKSKGMLSKPNYRNGPHGKPR